jgi:hypothetical protein
MIEADMQVDILSIYCMRFPDVIERFQDKMTLQKDS